MKRRMDFDVGVRSEKRFGNREKCVLNPSGKKTLAAADAIKISKGCPSRHGYSSKGIFVREFTVDPSSTRDHGTIAGQLGDPGNPRVPESTWTGEMNYRDTQNLFQASFCLIYFNI